MAKGNVIGENVFLATIDFPTDEKYNLTSQIRRAVDSIALNISEGSILQSKPEFQRFLGYTIRSCAELVTCLYKAKYRKYISDEKFDTLYPDCYNLTNMMIGFRNKL